MRWLGLVLLGMAALGSVRADELVREEFEAQGQWTTRVAGKGSVELVAGGVSGKCLKITCADGGTAYYTLKLDPERISGQRLLVRAMIRTQDVVPGSQPYCTAKFHFGGKEGRTYFNRAKWFTGTSDWHEETFVAPMPDKLTDPVFDLAVQEASGTLFVDDLVIDDGLKAHMPLNLKPWANTNFSDGVAGDGRGGFLDTGRLDLRDLPERDVEFGGVAFYVLAAGENHGATCLALRGLERPAFPLAPPAVQTNKGQPAASVLVPVGHRGKAVAFLQAAGWADPARTAPCLVYTVDYADGESVQIPMREGHDIGRFDAPRDLPNWKVAWTANRAGTTVGLGITRWQNPRPTVTIASIGVRTPGQGAVPVVAAITLIRD